MELEKTFRRFFKGKDRQILYGIVYEPDFVDSQDDFSSADEIEKAAHNFLVKARKVKVQHDEVAKASVVESYIAPADLNVGGNAVRKGSWVLVIKVNDSELWSEIKEGKYTGLSMGGTAVSKNGEENAART